MHTCLITAPTVTEFGSHAELFSEGVQATIFQPQLGPLRVAAMLEQTGDQPHFIDANLAYLEFARRVDNPRAHDFADYLARQAVQSYADIYGLSSICSTFPLSIRVAQAIKKMCPYAIVLFGGPQASVVDLAAMEAFPCIDFILRGEVEKTLPVFLQELNGSCDFAQVRGLTYREGALVRRNQEAPVPEDLDDAPAPSFHLSEYLKHSSKAWIELGRGCPFACTFCSTNDFFRRKFRLRSPARVLEEMRTIATTYGIRDFSLVHDMFTVDRKRVVAFCEEMANSGDGFTWGCSARTDCVDEELLELMQRSGCRSIFFGIESGSRKMQRVIDKDLDVEWAEQVLGIAQRLGMQTTASLITGFPEEDWDDVRATLRMFVRSARCSGSLPQLNLLAPLAGTPILAAHRHEMVLEELCSDMSHQGLSQSVEDLELIRAYPDIFPNFYLVPAKALERDLLFELREFVSASVARFRWLLCAIDQATDLLDFLQGWRAWRIQLRGDLIGADLRQYYFRPELRTDLLAFLREKRNFSDPSVAALVLAEEALVEGGRRRSIAPGEDHEHVPPGESLRDDDLLMPAAHTVVFALEYGFAEIAEALAEMRKPQPCGTVFHATRAEPDGSLVIMDISRWLACAVEAAAEARTVGAASDLLAAGLEEVPPEVRAQVVSQLLAGAREDGWICAYRAKAEPRASFESRDAMVLAGM